MKRTVPILAILAVGLSLMVVFDQSPQTFTVDEINQKIKKEKTAVKLALAEKGKSYEPGMFPSGWGFTQRAYPYGRINYEQIEEAVADARAKKIEAQMSYAAQAWTWVEEGPSNIGARVADLAMHPTNPNVVFAAMASGGVFKTTDGGATWSPITDDLPVLTIGAVALDPDDPDVIYAGTGEANAHSFSWFGMGMYKSTNGGLDWSYIGLSDTRYIGRIVVDPVDTERLWVAGTGALFGTNPERGVYRSVNGGDSWERVLFVSDSTAAIDVAIDPARPDTIYAAMWERVRGLTYRRSAGETSGLYRSFDGGDTWTERTTGLPTGPGVGRIGLSVCASSPNVIYAIYDIPDTYEARVYKSTDYGETWSRTSDTALAGIHSSFGWYFGQIRVDPTDPDLAFALGVPFYRTLDGGASWAEVGPGNHVDHHALVFDPADHTRIFEGNDGGVYVSTNSGTNWTKLYNQPTNQFYAIEIDNRNPQRLYGGTQDNGTLRTPTGATNDWEMIFGGDGFYTIVDPTNSNVIYAGYQWGNLYKSTDFGYNWSPATGGISGRTNWCTPVVMAPSHIQTLYYGSHQVFKTTNGAASWSAISGDLTNGDNGGMGTITTIAVAPSAPNVLYVGTDDSNVWVTQNGGGSWVNVSGSLPNRWVTRVAVDPVYASHAYVAFSGLRWNENIGYVYRTQNFGASWTDITGDLPGAPVNALVVDTDERARLIVGTDVGCYYTDNYGNNWQVLGAGLPPVPIFDLKLHNPTRTLVAGTHGRSMYSFDMTRLPPIVGVKPPAAVIVSRVTSYPNPFTENTSIEFSLARASRVSVEIYDIAGRRVRALEQGHGAAGEQVVPWDGCNDAGRRIASGVYFALVKTEAGVQTTRLTLIK